MTQQAIGVVPEFTICDRFRKARILTGLEQGPFALALGVSRGTVSNYENDTDAAFKPIVTKAWAEFTGVSHEWLMTGQGQPTSPGLPIEEQERRLNELARGKRPRRHARSFPTDPYVPAVA